MTITGKKLVVGVPGHLKEIRGLPFGEDAQFRFRFRAGQIARLYIRARGRAEPRLFICLAGWLEDKGEYWQFLLDKANCRSYCESMAWLEEHPLMLASEEEKR